MSRKQAIFILGMHRSGTSTVSNFITSLGYDLGRHPMALREDNPKGFWENTEITRVNDEILALHGLRWDSLTLIRDLPIKSICNDKQITSKVLQIVEEEFDADNICIKDPRMCHLLPLWKTVLNEANYETHYVTVNRDPAAVAKSLSKRDMMSFERGLLLWLLYSVSLARHIAGSSTIAIDYDELMKSPAGSLEPLKPLNPGEFEEQLSKFVDEFLSDNLYHHSPTETTNPLALYALTLKQTLGKGEDTIKLTNITRELDALVQVYSSREVDDNSTSLYEELSTTKAHAAQLEVERQRYDEYVLALSRQIDEQTEFSDSLKAELKTLNQELTTRSDYVSSLKTEIKTLNKELETRADYNDSLKTEIKTLHKELITRAEYVESLKNGKQALGRNIEVQDTYIKSMESSIIEMQTALKKKDEHASSLIQSISGLTLDRDDLKRAISEKISSSDEYIQSLLSTLEAKEVYLTSIDAQLETARSVIKNLEVVSQSKDSSIAKISAALLEEKKHIERLEGSTLVRVSARIAGISRLTKTDE
ncbi:MAG TPA: hypothetical protein EYG51_20615 [Pseudomonadales bacterium]|nr:hypothetical protein [Pseudomonadales bacterium]